MKQQMLITVKRELMQMRFIKQERKDGAQTKQGICAIFQGAIIRVPTYPWYSNQETLRLTLRANCKLQKVFEGKAANSCFNFNVRYSTSCRKFEC